MNLVKTCILFGLSAVGIFSGCATDNTPVVHQPRGVLKGEDLPNVVPSTKFATGDRQPKPIHMVNPEYPFDMRRKNVQAVVLVDFIVEIDGSVTISGFTNCPHPSFSDAILVAARKWRWEPGTREGKPVRCQLRTPLTFAIH